MSLERTGEMTVLLEREDCLEELDAALREAARGSGRIVLVYGEAGIGKTSVVDRFVELRRHGLRTLRGRCDSLFTPQPLGPLHDMAAHLPEQLQQQLQSAASRLEIFIAFLRELQHSPDPAVVVFEDVHWADAATLDLLKYLGRRLQDVRALVILTYRDDEIDREHPLWSVLGNLPSKMVRRLLVPPLSEAAVAMLAAPARRSSHELHALTGGNPFFVTELLASPGDRVPVTIREATLARAVRLSSTARTVLDFCSVVPDRTDYWLLHATIDPPAALLEECGSTGLLIVAGDVVRFRHELARQAVESALPAASAQALHARILAALLADGTARVPLAQIVHHAAGAQDSAAVRRYAPAAARHAASFGAHCQAADHYAIALRYTDPAEIEERASLLESCAYESYVTGQIEAGVEGRNAALELRRRQGDRAKEGDNLRWLSRLNWFLGRQEESVQWAKECIRVLETLPPGPEIAMAYSNCAQLYMLVDDSRAAIDWGNRALDLAERLGLTEVRVHALNNVGAAQLQLGDQQGWTSLELSLRLALEHDMHEHVCRAYTNLSWEAMVARDYARARRYFDVGLSYTVERDLDSWNEYMLGARARAHLEQGHWHQAAADAENVLQASRVPIQRISPLLVLGLVRVRRGDPGGEAMLAEARALALPTSAAMRIGPMAAARAEAAWLAGQNDECCEEARLGYEWAVRKGDARLIGQLSFWLWRAGSAPPDENRGTTPFEQQVRGNWQQAASEWQRLGCPYEEALALADGDSFARLRSLAILDELGAVRVAAFLRRKMRAQGIRRIPRGARPATKRNPAGLTAREMDILRLITDGLSNRRIAARLCISAKTVDHHVSAVLAKLDVASREQAAAQAIARGFVAQGGEVPAPR
jgi:DNA-binding CsgD family transcriptional regulator/tetratricopeptide (TPR) repeat protein